MHGDRLLRRCGCVIRRTRQLVVSTSPLLPNVTSQAGETRRAHSFFCTALCYLPMGAVTAPPGA